MAQAAPRPVDEVHTRRAARLAWEREQIAEGEADIAAGRVIRDEDLDAWLDDLIAGKPVALP